MTRVRYSEKAGEIPAKKGATQEYKAEAGKLRPKPQDGIDAIYGGREHISKKDWLHEEHAENNQFIEDAHDNGRGHYDNDVPLTGERAFLRGGGKDQHIYGSKNQNPLAKHGTAGQEAARKRAEAVEAINGGYKQPSGRYTATGQDMHKSPFSAAYRKGSGEGF